MSDELLMHRDYLREQVDERTADLNSAKLAAEDANRAKSEFLANITHELRTPIHAILSFSAIGQEQAGESEPARLKEYFGYVRDSGKRLVRLIDNLLDLSKMEARCMTFDISPQRLDHLVQDMGEELQGLLQEKQLLLVHGNSAIDTQLQCDAVRISQVLRNLLSNAIRYSPEGGRISIEIESTCLPNGKRLSDSGKLPALVTTISDQGIGIPQEELESIFDKFVQSSTTRSGAGGTGLGLAICREIIETHGGALSARNLDGGGAAFTFTLPRKPPIGGRTAGTQEGSPPCGRDASNT